MTKKVIKQVVFKNQYDVQEVPFFLDTEIITIEVAPMDWHIEDDSYTDEFGIVEQLDPILDKVMVMTVNGCKTPVLIEMAEKILAGLKKSGEIEFVIEEIN